MTLETSNDSNMICYLGNANFDEDESSHIIKLNKKQEEEIYSSCPKELIIYTNKSTEKLISIIKNFYKEKKKISRDTENNINTSIDTSKYETVRYIKKLVSKDSNLSDEEIINVIEKYLTLNNFFPFFINHIKFENVIKNIKTKINEDAKENLINHGTLKYQRYINKMTKHSKRQRWIKRYFLLYEVNNFIILAYKETNSEQKKIKSFCYLNDTEYKSFNDTDDNILLHINPKTTRKLSDNYTSCNFQLKFENTKDRDDLVGVLSSADVEGVEEIPAKVAAPAPADSDVSGSDGSGAAAGPVPPLPRRSPSPSTSGSDRSQSGPIAEEAANSAAVGDRNRGRALVTNSERDDGAAGERQSDSGASGAADDAVEDIEDGKSHEKHTEIYDIKIDESLTKEVLNIKNFKIGDLGIMVDKDLKMYYTDGGTLFNIPIEKGIIKEKHEIIQFESITTKKQELGSKNNLHMNPTKIINLFITSLKKNIHSFTYSSSDNSESSPLSDQDNNLNIYDAPLLLSQYTSPHFITYIKEEDKFYYYESSDKTFEHIKDVIKLIKEDSTNINSPHTNPLLGRTNKPTRESSHIGGGKKNKKKNRKIKKRSNKKRSYSKIKKRVNKS